MLMKTFTTRNKLACSSNLKMLPTDRKLGVKEMEVGFENLVEAAEESSLGFASHPQHLSNQDKHLDRVIGFILP